MLLCPNCFSERVDNLAYCPECRYAVANHSNDGVALAVGNQLNHGQYVIGRVLGKPGGFGITYLAWDLNLEVRVAIKELFPRQLLHRTGQGGHLSPYTENRETFQKVLEQFKNESRTLAQFRHPNIVRTRASFEENGTAYLVMDYLEGENLTDYITRTGPIFAPDAVALITPILSALGYIHSLNYIHRDVKPSNIYLTNEGIPMLLDFGSARQVLSDLSSSLSVVLTPGFAPFEQYQKKGKQGPWTDIYSCAATLYYMLTGRVPQDAIDRLTDDELLAPSVLVPGLSPKLSDHAMRGLLIEPKHRPQDAVGYRNELLLTVAQYTAVKTEKDAPIAVQPVNVAMLKKRTEPVPVPIAKPAANNDVRTNEKVVPHSNQSKGKWFGVASLLLVVGIIGFVAVGTGRWVEGKITLQGAAVSKEKPAIVENSSMAPIRFPNGDYYEGPSRQGLPDGLGTYVWANSDKYNGQWKNGRRTGQGAMTWKRGTSEKTEYVGLWANDKPAGTGKMSWDNGMWIEGEWQNGIITQGVIKSASYEEGMTMDYSGSIAGDIFASPGLLPQKEGHGTAYIYKKDGTESFRYIGAFKDDKMLDTDAQIQFSNGSSYRGAVKNNKFNGYGVFTWADGRKRAGNWEDDKPK